MPRTGLQNRNLSAPTTEGPGPTSSNVVWTPTVIESNGDGGGGEEEAIDFRRYLHAIRERLWLVIASVVVVAVAGGLYTLRQPKLYRATASVVIDTSTPKVLTGVTDVVEMGTGGWWANEAFYQTEYETIKSRAVAQRAAEKMGIPSIDPETGEAVEPLNMVLGRYEVEPDKKSQVVRLSVVDVEPKFAAELANAVAESYRELNLERRVDATRDASTWLSVQHQDLKQKLEGSEDNLYAFMQENNVLNASLESQLEEVHQRLGAFNGKLAEVQAERIRGELNAKALVDVRTDASLLDSLPEVRDAPVISALKTKLIELRTKRMELAARYQDEHPKMRAVDEQILLLEKNLEKEVDSVLLALDRKQASLATTIAGLKKAIAEERSREATLNKLSLDYGRLKREVETNSRLYELVTGRMKEADLTGALKLNNVRILDAAQVPEFPFKPNLRNNMVLALLLGLMLGIGLAIGLDALDNTVKSQQDVESILRAPFLGLLPVIDTNTQRGVAKAPPPKKGGDLLAAQRERDLFVMYNPKSQSAECARFIRTNLMFMSPDRPLKTMVLTSPSPQEGKTTTAVSLAITMAQAGSRTLIVDTDMRRPRLHRVFGLTNEAGLSSAIVGEASLDDVIQRTEAENLDILTCGPLPPNPAEILHTARFSEVLEELKSRYDRIIFDAPPVGAVTDPVILGTQLDGALLIVKCQKTSKDMARLGMRSLEDANVNVLGVVLNDVDFTSRRYGSYYYQYYRKYGGYYGESSNENETAKAS